MFQNNLLMAGASTAAAVYTVDNSVRYNDDDSPYLHRTPTTVGNRLTGTISLWYKRCNLGSIQQLFNSGAGNDISFTAADKLAFVDADSEASYLTTQVFRDPTAWGHLLFAWDTTDTTAGDRLRIYHNGVEITVFDTETNPNVNWGMGISNNVRQTIGANEGNTEEFDGYLSQFYYVDGQMLTPTSFGEFDTSGVWRPIEFEGGGTGYSGSLVPVMTDYTAPSGEVTFSSEYSSFWKAWYAFNNSWDDTNAWIPTLDQMGWLAYEFTSSQIITRYIFGVAQWNQNSGARDWTFEGWTGSEWVVLDTQTSVTWDAAPSDGRKAYTFSNTTAYIKYKLDITADNGATNTGTNELMMIGASSGYGTNGFFLDFADSSDFGNDVSGNNNDYTSSGLAANDQVVDTPTKNYPTFASNMGRYFTYTDVEESTLSNGSLEIAGAAGGWSSCDVNFTPLNSGKWYFTWDHDTWYNGNNDMGITNVDNRSGLNGDLSHGYHSQAGAILIGLELSTILNIQTEDFTNIGGTIPFTTTTSDQNIVAVDIDNLKMWCGLWDQSADEIYWLANDASWSDANVDVPATGTDETCAITGSDFTFYSGSYSTRGGSVDFGSVNGGILSNITQPSGFNVLNTANVATPTILDGTANFQTTLYTGDGSIRNIDQTENSTFQPDMVWIKNRSAADNHVLIDATRGVTKEINPNTADAESTDANGLTSFDSDGFGLGTGAGGYNDNTENFVAWQWLAGGGAGSSNEDGSINTTTTTANTTAGISIGTYTGTGVNATIGHGLGVAPQMVIVRDYSTFQAWIAYHEGVATDAATDYLFFYLTNAAADAATIWNDTAPTSTVFSIGTDSTANANTKTFVYYAFASIEGFSKFSSYTGNGDADGTYTYTGFKPAFVIIKKTSGTGNWVIYDSQRSPYNEIDDQLLVSSAAAETTGSEEIDFLSNGFKIRTADSDVNTSAGNYIYMAFAEYPFGGDGATPATSF